MSIRSGKEVKSQRLFDGFVCRKLAANSVIIYGVNDDIFGEFGLFAIIKSKGDTGVLTDLNTMSAGDCKLESATGNICDQDVA